MAVIYNTNYTHNPNSYLTLAIERAARSLFGEDQVVLADNMTLAAYAGSGEHDTLICIDGQRINLPLMRRIRPAFKTMILWTFEDPFMRDFNVENADLFDFVFTNDPSCAEYYRGRAITFLWPPAPPFTKGRSRPRTISITISSSQARCGPIAWRRYAMSSRRSHKPV